MMRKDSGILRGNLQKGADRDVDPGTVSTTHNSPAAHHIVEGEREGAAPARAALFSACISINEAINGVFLPAFSKSSNNCLNRTFHNYTQQADYTPHVNRRLKGIKHGDRAGTVGELRKLRRVLAAGNAPWMKGSGSAPDPNNPNRSTPCTQEQPMPAVYEVMPYGNEFQTLSLTEWWLFDEKYPFDGRPIGDDWEAPEVYVRSPLLGTPDIWPIAGTAYAYEQHVLDAVRDIVTPVGELLPLMWEGRELSVLNVTYVADCFDRENGVSDEEYPHIIEEYAFDLSRLKHSLFKLPEEVASSLLAVEGLWSPDREFKAIVEQHEFQGIWFRQLWTDEE